MGSKKHPAHTQEVKERKRLKAERRQPRITVHGNTHLQKEVIRSQLELQGYVIFDESSPLTKEQMQWLMENGKRVKGERMLCIKKEQVPLMMAVAKPT